MLHSAIEFVRARIETPFICLWMTGSRIAVVYLSIVDLRLPSLIRRKGDRPDHSVLGEGKAPGKQRDRANQQRKKDREEKHPGVLLDMMI
jgi:hypothetical protein